jgi:hypothetical protein
MRINLRRIKNLSFGGNYHRKIHLILILLVIIYFYFYYNLSQTKFNFDTNQKINQLSKKNLNFYSSSESKLVNKINILLITSPIISRNFEYIIQVLTSLDLDFLILRIYDKESSNIISQLFLKSYVLVIIESFDLITKIDAKSRFVLFNYCNTNSIGIIFFTNTDNINNFSNIEIRNKSVDALKSCKLNNEIQKDSFYKITKSSQSPLLISNRNYLKEIKALSYFNDDNNYKSVIECENNSNLMIISTGDSCKTILGSTKCQINSLTNIRKVFISIELEKLPILSILFMDALSFASYNKITFDLKRFIQIDIDDMFVEAIGKRLKPNDVTALLNFQDFLSKKYFINLDETQQADFKFNLGFSGFYYQKGNDEENEADRQLISL